LIIVHVYIANVNYISLEIYIYFHCKQTDKEEHIQLRNLPDNNNLNWYLQCT